MKLVKRKQVDLINLGRTNFIFAISAPFSLAILGTYLVDNLLSYFESVMGLKTEKSED